MQRSLLCAKPGCGHWDGFSISTPQDEPWLRLHHLPPKEALPHCQQKAMKATQRTPHQHQHRARKQDCFHPNHKPSSLRIHLLPYRTTQHFCLCFVNTKVSLPIEILPLQQAFPSQMQAFPNSPRLGTGPEVRIHPNPSHCLFISAESGEDFVFLLSLESQDEPCVCFPASQPHRQASMQIQLLRRKHCSPHVLLNPVMKPKPARCRRVPKRCEAANSVRAAISIGNRLE